MITPNQIIHPSAVGLLQSPFRKDQAPAAAFIQGTQSKSKQLVRQSDHVRFGRGSAPDWKPLTQADTDARRLLQALKSAGAQLPDDEEGIAQLKADGNLPCKKAFYFGIVRMDGGKPVVTGMSRELQPVADLLFQNQQSLSEALQAKLKNEGLPLVLRVAPPDEQLKTNVLTQLPPQDHEALQKAETEKVTRKQSKTKENEDENDNPYKLFMDNVFLKSFSLKKKNGETLPAIAWPILQRIISSKNPLPAKKEADSGPDDPIGNFAAKIQQLGLYELYIPSDGLAEDDIFALHEKFQPLRTRLSAYKLMEKHYLESIDVKEVAWPMMTGVLVGGGGETALELAHLEGSPHAGLIRTGLLVGVDVIDNMFAQIPNIYQHASKNGLKKDAKAITGSDSWKAYFAKMLKGDFKLKGELGPTIQDALSSAVLGAASGSLFALPAGNVLSNERESVLARAVTGGLGAWGTSLSLPVKLQKDRNKMVESLNQMIAKGWIQAPKDKKAKEAFIQEMLLQEAMAGTGNSTSLKAFGLVPLLSGGLLALEQLGLSRKWAQRLYMSISPGAENLLSLILMMDRNYRTAGRSMKAAETRILHSGNQGFTEQDQAFYASQFSDGAAKFIGNLATNPWSFYGILGVTLAGLYAYMLKHKLLDKSIEVAPSNAPSATSSKPSRVKLGQAHPVYGKFPAPHINYPAYAQANQHPYPTASNHPFNIPMTPMMPGYAPPSYLQPTAQPWVYQNPNVPYAAGRAPSFVTPPAWQQPFQPIMLPYQTGYPTGH